MEVFIDKQEYASQWPKRHDYLSITNFFFFPIHPITKINIQDFEATVAAKAKHRRENYPPNTYT